MSCIVSVGIVRLVKINVSSVHKILLFTNFFLLSVGKLSVIHTVYSYLAIELYIDQHASEYQHIIIVIYWLNDKKKIWI